MKKNYYIFMFISVVVSFSTFSVSASTLKMELDRCAQISENVTRLACFDNLTTTVTLPTAVVSTKNSSISDTKSSIAGTKAMVSNAPIKPVVAPTVNKDDSFGAEHLIRKSASQEIKQVVFTVAKLTKGPHKKWRFTFKNGQIWKQTDNNHFRIKVDDSVILKKGALGAIYMKKNSEASNRSIRVKRVK